MLPNRIRISKKASDQLLALKAKTGITPNILARIALTSSLKNDFDFRREEVIPNGLEFLMHTLLGEYQEVYESILIKKHNIYSMEDLTVATIYHIENGISSISTSKDITALVFKLNDLLQLQENLTSF